MNRWVAGLVVAANLTLVMTAQGALQTYLFEGTVAEKVPVGSPVSSGDVIRFVVTFDDSALFDAGSGSFNDAVVSYSIDASGDVELVGGPIVGSSIAVQNDVPVDSIDFYVSLDDVDLGGLFVSSFSLSLYDSTGTAFTSDSLPTSAPDLSAFDSATFRIDFAELAEPKEPSDPSDPENPKDKKEAAKPKPISRAHGTITRLEDITPSAGTVPEPATLAVWGAFGAMGLGLSLRRRKQAA